jgi:hypothetical protein
LNRLGLRYPREARHERGDEYVIELESRSHPPSMPYDLAAPCRGP